MEIAENLTEWQQHFEAGWLAHYQKTAVTNFSLYQRVKNQQVPGSPGIDLSQSRLLFISTAGAYLPATQTPFDAASKLGDYTIRLLPTSTPLNNLDYAHDHYDQQYVREDAQVLLPLHHLDEMVTAGQIGELHPTMISFMGYQPDVTQIIDTLLPAVEEVALDAKIDGALLVPA